MLLSRFRRFSLIRTLFLLCLFINTPSFFAYHQYAEERATITNRNASLKRAPRPNALLELIADNMVLIIPVALLGIFLAKNYLNEPGKIGNGEPPVAPFVPAAPITAVKIYSNGYVNRTVRIAPIVSCKPPEPIECYICLDEIGGTDDSRPLVSVCGDQRHCCHAACLFPVLLDLDSFVECEDEDDPIVRSGGLSLGINYQTSGGHNRFKVMHWDWKDVDYAGARQCLCRKSLEVETRNKIIQQFLYEEYMKCLKQISPQM